MNKFKYIIIGGGMTGDAAVSGIRELDKEGSIAVISMETHPPYKRPPLSKGLWKNTPEDKIWKNTGEQNAVLLLNSKVLSINDDNSVSIEPDGKLYFEKLLLATGGIINKLPFSEPDIIYYRTYDDYKKLRELTDSKSEFAVIGGGFIGSEIAAALAMNGKKVTMIFPQDSICSKLFPAELAGYINSYYTDKGIRLVNNETVKDIRKAGGRAAIITSGGKSIEADAIVAGIGVKPDAALAKAAGIKTDNGIIVNEQLMTNLPNIYAAGDAANFYNPQLDKRIRVEHEDNANKMGKQAGRSMAGDKTPYNYLPFFYSDMFELGYEAVGELDSRLETVQDWKENFKEGVVYYIDKQMVKGILLWNVWGQVDEARKLIGEKGHLNPQDLIGRLPVKKS